jgi:hypothetical protein
VNQELGELHPILPVPDSLEFRDDLKRSIGITGVLKMWAVVKFGDYQEE